MEKTDKAMRKARKEEARRLKRKRIEDAGGVRPRSKKDETKTGGGDDAIGKQMKGSPGRGRPDEPRRQRKQQQHHEHQGKHRFGRVMEHVPCPNKPRKHTVSIAIPGSVVSNRQTNQLRTHLVGQIARAATVYHVDEIIVFDDKLSDTGKGKGFYRRNDWRNSSGRHRDRKDKHHKSDEGEKKEGEQNDGDGESRPSRPAPTSDPHAFMARLLQFCECPQYLRRQFFPMHPDLEFSGLLSPIDAPHHVRAEDKCKYREGVVLDKKADNGKGGSLVNCGIKSRPVEIDRVLTPGIRCTVKLDVKSYDKAARMKGTVVSPTAPWEEDGTYWGYTTRLADGIKAVFDECPYEGGYDLKIGTSERGNVSVDDKGFKLPTFEHALIMFGGVAGIEECVDADESMTLPGKDSMKLFDVWVNTCPFQGSRTIRTEEAVLISLARLRPLIAMNGPEEVSDVGKTSSTAVSAEIKFSDDEMSDESAESDE